MKAIRNKFKRGKTPGPDDMTTDEIKDLDDSALEILRKCINEEWETGDIPDEATTARVVSLHKKGNPDKQENYRPISLLNTCYKIIAAVMQRRLAKALDKYIMKTQFGFRSKRSTIDALFIARRLQEHAERRGNKGLMLLLDWEKAFDKIEHEMMFTALENMCIPEELLKIIKGLYKNPQFYVEIEGIQSTKARQNTGIRQGCPLSPYLFILVMDRLFAVIPKITERLSKELKLPPGREEGFRLSFQALLYADDTLLCEDNEEKMRTLLLAIEEVSEAFGLRLNKDKCQQMSVGKTKDILFKDGTAVPRTTMAEYLGGILQEKADPRMEILKRISKAAYGRNRLNTFWRKTKLSKRKKILIYEALISSKLMYAMETVPIPEGWGDRIDAEYLKGIRQILDMKTTYGQMQEGNARTNSNEEIIKMLSNYLSTENTKKIFKPVSERIKERAIKLLGRVLRQTKDEPEAEILIGDSDTWNIPLPKSGEMRDGRPRVNWAIETAKSAWLRHKMYEEVGRGRSKR